MSTRAHIQKTRFRIRRRAEQAAQFKRHVNRERRTKCALQAVPGDHLVSDHAIVRWLERVTGIDVRGKICAEMLDGDRLELIQKIRDGEVNIDDSGIVLHVRNGCVTSVSNRSHRG